MTDTIKNFPNRLHRMTQVFYREVPSQVAARRFVDSLANLLFPVRDRRGMSLKEMDLRWENLQQDFLHIITPLCSGMDCCCERLTARFFAEIPLIYAGLMKDANLYKSCDPAAYCTEEVILCYPGFYAVMVYRLSHVMHRLNIPVLPRVVSEYAHSQTGIDIHPGATIGPRFYIDHGTGIVIGETTVIGRQAASDHRGQRHHLRRQHDSRRRHGRRPRHGDRRKRLADRIGTAPFDRLPQARNHHQRKVTRP